MNTTPFKKTGLETLLTPENSALILIDHQPFQFAVSPGEAHEMGIQRMIQAGAVPLTRGVLSAEWQRDWAREATVPGLGQIVVEHYGATGTSFLWEQQLLNQGGSNRR